MTLKHLLIANRGEIAIRIARSAAESGVRSHAIYSEDDEQSDHVSKADEAHRLTGSGPSAYLDAQQIIRVARETNCDAIHPGYGFLSENPDFARSCEQAGLGFVGPTPDVLDAFGDKGKARSLAVKCDVPVLPGTDSATSLEEVRTFLKSLGKDGAIMIKAIAGGGGRGTRPVFSESELESTYQRCSSEAMQSFGNGEVYVERLFPLARHIEVQVIGDGSGEVTHLWERECSLQRNRQKLVEIAPAPGLSAELRERLIDASLRMARAVKLRSLATFEFLVEQQAAADSNFACIEANARLQVEHTVTEEVTGIDLVRTQLDIAGGRTLQQLGLTVGNIPTPRGIAMQVRVNAETMASDGVVRPSIGMLEAFDPPSGPGVRVDTCGHGGFRVNPRFDSLLAKVIVHVTPGDLASVSAKAMRALSEFRIAGVSSNREFLLEGHWYTGLIEDNLAALCAPGQHPQLYGESRDAGAQASQVDRLDPLAILSHGKRDVGTMSLPDEPVLPDGMQAISAVISGTLVSIDVGAGDTVKRGQQVAIMEAMKMEYVIVSPVSGVVQEIRGAQNQTLFEGTALLTVSVDEEQSDTVESEEAIDLDRIRPDLAQLQHRRALTQDAARPDAVEKRHKLGFRTARENIADLCDADSFHEYGAFAVAAQRSRRTMEDLIARTPADGMVTGIGRVNGDLFADVDARCMVMSYDYTVLAGTQGHKNHQKKDRIFELAAEWRLPLIAFAEGGGGRPGDTDILTSGWLNIKAFTLLAKLSGLVPLVGIVSGRCFAGNAVVAGTCDVIIATERTSLGMGGPAIAIP